ncbi:MAG: hypothetical protein U1A78_10915 [Polyangia bacterium]
MRCAVLWPRSLAPAVAVTALLGAAGPAAAAYAVPSKLPTLRPRLGAAFHGTKADPAARSVDFAVDVALGYPFWVVFGEKSSPLRAPMLTLYPELSYTYQRPGLHLFTAGGYLGVGSMIVSASYGARFVAGVDELGQTALGVRHGVGLHLVLDFFTIEATHQPLWSGGALRHDVQLWFSLNPLSVFGALLGF